ncbi:unnamed protein product [Rotaria sp. Silwood2]|nr:unnamed protein product [Rotaria sp. Silwood2]
MNDSIIQLSDLPDEILMIILKKLHNSYVLYSLIGVNKRLDTIAKDSIFTEYLTLIPPFNGLNEFTDTILDRFCSEVLPKIHHKIEWLNTESLYIERILLATNYPVLHGLGLYDLASEVARNLFTDRSFLIRIFKNQILSLVIHINKCQESSSSIKDINTFIYTQILIMFKNLRYLNFGPNASDYHQLTFGVSPPNVFSSILLDLCVVVDSYADCLYLLDGRFHQLKTFYVTICSSDVSSLPLINSEKKKLSNLKCFMLTHKSVLLIYNTFLIPLLHRMSNLEELSLYFVNHDTPIIDGNNLEMNIMNYMRKLKEFKFNIRSVTPFNNQVNLPSNDDIKNTFKNFKNNQIISSIDYFPKANEFHCHIYSYPYTLMYYDNISNNFRGGLFKCVRKISLFDERPFEHEFFLRLSQSFPFMTQLVLHNRESQKNDNQQRSIIEYFHLIILDLLQAHENYVEQFFNNSKMCLLNNIHLHVDYNTLQRVTDNFTSDATRMNCFKIVCLILYNKPELCLDLKDYFPHAEIR